MMQRFLVGLIINQCSFTGLHHAQNYVIYHRQHLTYFLVHMGSMWIGIQPVPTALSSETSQQWGHFKTIPIAHSNTHTPPSVFPTLCSLHKHHLGVGLEVVPAEKHLFPPEAAQLSMLCLSTRGSSCAERWAARRTKRQKESEERDVNVQNHSKLYICTFYNSRVKS